MEKAYYIFKYQFKNGCILLDDPILGGSRVVAKCDKEPESCNQILGLLSDANFAPQRLVKCGNDRYVSQSGSASDVSCIMVEKALPFLGDRKNAVMVVSQNEAKKLVTRPCCTSCKEELGYGMRCDGCGAIFCKKCEPDFYYEYRGENYSGYAIRLVLRPRCNVCLPI